MSGPPIALASQDSVGDKTGVILFIHEIPSELSAYPICHNPCEFRPANHIWYLSKCLITVGHVTPSISHEFVGDNTGLSLTVHEIPSLDSAYLIQYLGILVVFGSQSATYHILNLLSESSKITSGSCMPFSQMIELFVLVNKIGLLDSFVQ